MSTADSQPDSCPLCHSPARQAYTCQQRSYYQCPLCHAVFMAAQHRPAPQQEKARYLEHHNDIHDPRYQRFVSPITHAVMQDFPPSATGLDFGAGTGPVIAALLRQQGYPVRLYDPFFHPDPQALQLQYDFIVCCEVMEHFFHPDKEFHLLKQRLKPGGRLYCMTQLFHEDIDFQRWNYARDPTHVFFYHARTIDYIRKQCHFSDAVIAHRLIIFS